MNDTQAHSSAATIGHEPVRAAPAGFIFLILFLAMVLQLILYWPTTKQLPFGDDWGVPLSEIFRGDTKGLLSFFTETRQPDSYRPVQSLLMWLFGRIDEPGRWMSIRVLHFICSGILMASLGLMLHAWRIGRSGVAVAMVVAALHPTLVAPVGSIDGFSSTLSCAFVWFGVWAMYVTRHRPVAAIVLACAALVLGTLVKEYAFALAPMAVLTAVTFFDRRWRGAILSAIALGLLTFALLWVRQYAKPADLLTTEPDFQLDAIRQIATNAGLVSVGGLFFGDALSLFLDRSTLMRLVSGVIFLLAIFYLVMGWWRRMRLESEESSARLKRMMLFLILSFAAVTFPANVVMRISEMYLCGLVVTVALMFALAADGWCRVHDSNTVASWIVMLALAVTSGFAIVHKMDGMLEMGKLAKPQADQLVAIVKNLPEVKQVKLLYRKDQLQEKPTFSSYRLADCYLIRPTAAWVLFPGRDLQIDCVPPLPDEAAVRAADRSDADIVLYWDVARQAYERLK